MFYNKLETNKCVAVAPPLRQSAAALTEIKAVLRTVMWVCEGLWRRSRSSSSLWEAAENVQDELNSSVGFRVALFSVC